MCITLKKEANKWNRKAKNCNSLIKGNRLAKLTLNKLDYFSCIQTWEFDRWSLEHNAKTFLLNSNKSTILNFKRKAELCLGFLGFFPCYRTCF